jgi:hypothetical protein
MRPNQLTLRDPGNLGIFALMAKALSIPPRRTEVLARQGADAAPAAADAALSGSPARRRGLLERLDHWFWVQQQREREAYLAKATDVYDLEARIRALERSVPHPYY